MHELSLPNKALPLLKQLCALAKSQDPADVTRCSRLEAELLDVCRSAVALGARQLIVRHPWAASELDDLLQEGLIGLLSAARDFEEDGYPSFLSMRAMGAMQKYLRDRSNLIREPHGSQASRARSGAPAPVTLDLVASADESSPVVEDFAPQCDERLDVRQALDVLEAESRLDFPTAPRRRQLDALKMRFYGSLTYAAIGSRLGVSTDYAHTLVEQGLARLKPLLEG